MASKAAIGKITTDALNRIKAAIGVLVVQFGVNALDLDAVRDRDPMLQHALRLETLAAWLEDLHAKLEAAGMDLSGAEYLSQQLNSIRFVLDLALNFMTVPALKNLCDDLGLEFKGQIKQEYVNAIVEHLTGQRLILVNLNELAAEAEDED